MTGNGRAARWLVVLALLAVMTLGLLQGTGLAQDVDPRSTARTRLGPLYLAPRFVLQDFGIDSNVFNSVDEPKSDFTFTFTPELGVATGFRRALFAIKFATDLVYFAEYKTERSVNQDLKTTVRVSLRRVTLFAESSYLSTRTRPNEEIDARSRRIERSGEVGIRIGLSSKLSTRLTGSRSEIEFDADEIFDSTRLAETLNRDTRSATAALRYAVTPLTAVVVGGEASETRFTRSPIRDSNSWRIFTGVEFNPRALISGEARVGYQRFRPVNDALPDFSGPVASVGLSYRFLGSMVLGLSLDRHLGYSYAEREPYYVSEGYGVSFRRQLAQRFDVTLSARRLRYRYRLLSTEVGTETTTRGRNYLVRNDSVALGYRLSTGARFSVGLSYWERRSDQRDLRNFDGLRVGTTVTYGF